MSARRAQRIQRGAVAVAGEIDEGEAEGVTQAQETAGVGGLR